MNNDNAEQLKKLAKVFNTDNIITPREIESVLTAITKILASFKKQNQELNDETKAVLNVLFNKISDEHNRSLQTLSDKNDKTLEEVSKSKKDIDSKITKALSKLEQSVKDVLAMKPENGKDADEEKIVEDVLSKIILPEYKETVLDGGEEIVEKINGLSLDPENQIDASHIKNLPIFSGGKFGKSGTRYLKDLVDVNLDGLTITDGKYDLGSGSGGGGGGSSFNDQTPNTDASYGTLAGDVDGANTTFTVSEGEYLTGKLLVYLNGQLQEQGSTSQWTETTPASGTFDFLVAPTIGDTVTASYETVASSGGIQSVVAGTNVTVDNTDPLNPVVSATGGGGGGTWGSITGTLSDQTDLQSALNAITPNATHTGEVIGDTALSATEKIISNRTDTAVAAGDYFLYRDDTDSTLKKDTVQGILDLVSGGSGDVSKVGTPVDNQVGVWTGDGTIEGTSGLVFSSNALGIGGVANVGAYSGSVATVRGSDSSIFEMIRDITSSSSLLGRFVAGSTANSVSSSIDFRSGSTGAKGEIRLMTSNGTTNTEALRIDEAQKATFYNGGVNLDYSTASRVPVLDASKNLIASSVTSTELGYVSGVTSAIQTQLNAKLTSASTITDGFTKTFVGTGANGTYTLRLKIPFAGTITETTSISSAGTATATFKINTTALGGTANSVSSSEQSQAQASANTFSAGDDINVEITSASSLTNMTLSVTYTRALA